MHNAWKNSFEFGVSSCEFLASKLSSLKLETLNFKLETTKAMS